MGTARVVSIFDYTDYRIFLRDYYVAQKEATGYFSYRWFSQKAGFSSHNVLKQVIEGTRGIASKSIEKYTEALGLSDSESEYFKALVLYCQAKSDEERVREFANLERLKAGAGGTILKEEQHRVYAEWHHLAVRELVHLKDIPISGDMRPFARLLIPRISVDLFEKSLRLLEKIELIERGKDGFWHQCARGIKTLPEVRSSVIREHNRRMVRMADDAAARFSPDQREISGMMLTLSPEMYSKIKKKIQDFKEEILSDVLADSKSPQSVCQLNFQLFPLAQENDLDL